MDNQTANPPLVLDAQNGDGATKNSGVMSDILSTLFMIFFMCLLVAAYHFFWVAPALDEAKTYYVMDLDALMEAKAMQLIERERSNPLRSEDELLEEAHQFRSILGKDMLLFSKGYPIFQKGVILRADSRITDLTPLLANHYGLMLPEKNQ